MANIQEQSRWSPEIYQIETGDSVMGGVPDEVTGAGKSNLPTKQLADRTVYLKEKVDEVDVENLLALLTRMVSDKIESENESDDSRMTQIEADLRKFWILWPGMHRTIAEMKEFERP